MKKIVFAFLALLFGCANFYAQVGTLDSSFGNGGIATSPFMSNGDDVAKDVKIQSDGKILVGGISSGGLTNDFVIARYLINGDLDPTFGNGGFVKTDITGYNDELTRLYLQDNGKIIAIGYGKINNIKDAGIVIRYNSNGNIDTTFGVNGITYITRSLNISYYLHGIDFYQGNYYLSGHLLDQTVQVQPKRSITLKLNNNGIQDFSYGTNNGLTSNGFDNLETFANDIKAMPDNTLINCYYLYVFGETYRILVRNLSGVLLGEYPINEQAYRANSLGVQSNGKIVIGGANFKAGRLNSNYITDVTFGINGISFPLSISGNQNRTIVLPNDKIVSVGRTSVNYFSDAENNILIGMHNAEGIVDTSFNTNGHVVFDLSGNNDAAYSVAGLSNGQIVVVGYATTSSDKDFIILKYNADGTLDSSFGNNGKVLSDFSESIDFGIQHVVLNNGKIVVAVNSSHINYNLMGFNSDGTLDTTFGVNGKVSTTVSNNNNNSNITILAKDLNDKIWAFGNYIAKYNADGSLDTSFSSDGIMENNFLDLKSATIQSDGKLLIGGMKNSKPTIVRLQNDGNLDTQFGNNGYYINSQRNEYAVANLKIDNNGNIIFVINDGSNTFLYKININGIINSTFGGIGYVTTNVNSLDFKNIDLLSDGRIILGYYGSYFKRYLNNGLLDPSFSEDGQINHSFPNAISYTNKVVAQPDGKTIVTYTNELNSNQNIVVTRLNYDGTIDTTFGTNGCTEIDYQGKNNNGNFISLFEDKILITGTLINNNNQDVALYRFNNDYVVGVSDLLKASTKVFPNPFTDYLNIESDMGAIDSITIYDTKGSLCGTYNNNQIDLSHLKAGMYFVKITQNDKSFVAKVFKN
jgi:uncharacterized delta-60 repeat protein